MQILTEILDQDKKRITKQLNDMGFDSFTATRMVDKVGEQIILASVLGHIDIDASLAQNSPYLLKNIKVEKIPGLTDAQPEIISAAINFLVEAILGLLKAKFGQSDSANTIHPVSK